MASTLEKIDRMLTQSELRKMFLSSRLSLVSLPKLTKNKILNYLTATHPSTESRSTAIERGTYLKAKTLTYEASIWIGLILACLTSLFDEFLQIFVSRPNVFGGFPLTEGYIMLETALESLLPTILIVVFFMFGVKGRSFPKSPSRSRFLDETAYTPSVSYIRQVWKKIMVAVTVFVAIYFPWHWFFTSYIMFEPFPFWEIPTQFFNIPEMLFGSWIIVAVLSILLLMIAVETFAILGFVKQEDSTSID